MRRTALLVAAVLAVAPVLAQNISLDARDMPLKGVVDILSKSSGVAIELQGDAGP